MLEIHQVHWNLGTFWIAEVQFPEVESTRFQGALTLQDGSCVFSATVMAMLFVVVQGLAKSTSQPTPSGQQQLETMALYLHCHCSRSSWVIDRRF